MLGYSILKSLFDGIIATGLVKKIHHSVVLSPLAEGGWKPEAPVNGRFVYVGVDDTKGFTAYCRQNGSAEVTKIEKLGSCNKNLYTFQIPHKMVFYSRSDNRSHDDILSQLIKAMIGASDIKVQKVTNNPEDTMKTEVPTANIHFKEGSFYCSIDFFVLLKLQADTCEQEISCKAIKNPYC